MGWSAAPQGVRSASCRSAWVSAISGSRHVTHSASSGAAWRIGARMRAATVLVTALAISAGQAQALEYAGTCRGATATITAIEGLDGPRARAEAQYALPDAVSYCHYSLGRSAGKGNPSQSAINSCADKFMRDAASRGPLRAEANCQTGSISTSGSKWSNAYKLPLTPICGDDNNQAISLFRVLCPSYEGKIEGLD